MNDYQKALIERAKKASVWLRLFGVDLNDGDLPILAREFDYFAKRTLEMVAMQQRAFRDDALLPQQPEPAPRRDAALWEEGS